MNRQWLEGIAARHDNAASAIRNGTGNPAMHPSIIPTEAEHLEIVDAVRMLLKITADHRVRLASAAMGGLLAGMSSDPATPLSGPQIAATAVDIADEMIAALTANPL